MGCLEMGNHGYDLQPFEAQRLELVLKAMRDNKWRIKLELNYDRLGTGYPLDYIVTISDRFIPTAVEVNNDNSR